MNVKTPKKSRHKLAAVTYQPYLVKSVQDTIVFIGILDQSVESVSGSLVTSATPPLTKEKLQSVTDPMTDEELETDYATKVNVYTNGLPRSTGDDKEDLELRSSSCLRQRKNKNTNNHNSIDLGLD